MTKQLSRNTRNNTDTDISSHKKLFFPIQIRALASLTIFGQTYLPHSQSAQTNPLAIEKAQRKTLKRR